MIIDLQRFLDEERGYWSELEDLLKHLDEEVLHRMELEEAKRFHGLYQRASADLARLETFAAEPGTRQSDLLA